MPLHSEILADVRYDYERHRRTENMMLLPESQKAKPFWEWFGLHGYCYPISEYIPTVTGMPLSSGECYGNAQRIRKISYCEGFIQLSGRGWIPHGFNILSNEVVDYTVVCNTNVFTGSDKPISYVGILIPDWFIKIINFEREHKSLLYQFYLEDFAD